MELPIDQFWLSRLPVPTAGFGPLRIFNFDDTTEIWEAFHLPPGKTPDEEQQGMSENR